MAPAAYGAFVIHARVLVALALAIQAISVTAELTFVCVLTGGVAGSFALAALARRLRPIDRILGARPTTVPDLPHLAHSLEIRS
jgi:hypothetical protein